MKVVVADLYQLSRINGNKFSTDPNKGEKIRENAKVMKEYVEEVNANSADSGKKYVIKEEETKKHYERVKGASSEKSKPDQSESDQSEKSEYDQMKKDDLIDLAESAGIELQGNENKKQIIEKLNNYED